MDQEAAAAIKRAAEDPERATPDLVEPIAQDLAAAFVDDPLFCWFLRDDAKRGEGRLRMFRLMLREIGFPGGDVLMPAMGGAAAVWIPSFKMGPNPWWQELRALPTLLHATGLGRFARLAAMRAAMDEHHPMDRPHAYLWLLGVRPELQGLGVGSRLLKSRLDILDAQRMPAFLETATERNVAFYQRNGFSVLSEYRPGGDGPRNWAMWREPQA